MGEALYERLIAASRTITCRIYAPVGGHRDLLAYLVRRLLENGANSSFRRSQPLRRRRSRPILKTPAGMDRGRKPRAPPAHSAAAPFVAVASFVVLLSLDER